MFVFHNKTRGAYLFRIVGRDEDCDCDGSVGVEAIATGYAVAALTGPVARDMRKRTCRCRLPGDGSVVGQNFPSKN